MGRHYELTPEQLERDRRMVSNLWTVLDNAPEKIVEYVTPRKEAAAPPAEQGESPDAP